MSEAAKSELSRDSDGYRPVGIPQALKVVQGKPIPVEKEELPMDQSAIIRNNLIERIDFIQLSVSDLDASKSWYAQHLGFKEDYCSASLCVMMPPQPIPSGLPTLCLNKAGKQSNWFQSGDKKHSTVGLHCKDIRQLRDYFTEQQIEVSEIEDGGFAFFMSFFDPDRNMFEVIQLK